MDLLSLIVVLLLAASMAWFVFMMAWRIGRNVVTGNRYREALAEELDRLRISRMLAALGISMGEYTHKQSVLDIRRQISNCEACGNTDTCDSKLDEGEIAPEQIDFCANAGSMRELHGNTQN